QAIKGPKSMGAISLESFQGDGLDVKNVEIPVVLEDGILKINYPTKGATTAPSAQVNTGALNLGGIAINLADKSPRLNTTNLPLAQNVALNPILAKNILKFSPLFADANQAAGLLNINIINAKDLALTDLTSP